MSDLPKDVSPRRKWLAQMVTFLREIVLRVVVQLVINIIFRFFC